MSKDSQFYKTVNLGDTEVVDPSQPDEDLLVDVISTGSVFEKCPTGDKEVLFALVTGGPKDALAVVKKHFYPVKETTERTLYRRIKAVWGQFMCRLEDAEICSKNFNSKAKLLLTYCFQNNLD